MPVGYDGKNHFSQELGTEYGKGYVWRWHTGLPFYILAGFFALVGTSTFVCRLPFALAGIGTVVTMYYYAKMLWRSRRAGVLAAVIIHAAIYHRDRLRHVVVMSLISAALSVPWMIYIAGEYTLTATWKFSSFTP